MTQEQVQQLAHALADAYQHLDMINSPLSTFQQAYVRHNISKAIEQYVPNFDYERFAMEVCDRTHFEPKL